MDWAEAEVEGCSHSKDKNRQQPADGAGVVSVQKYVLMRPSSQQVDRTHRRLMGAPHLPNVHLRGGRGCRLMRLRSKQLMERLYEASRAARSTARNAFSAAVDPILTTERTTQKVSETSTAFNGMLQRG